LDSAAEGGRTTRHPSPRPQIHPWLQKNILHLVFVHANDNLLRENKHTIKVTQIIPQVGKEAGLEVNVNSVSQSTYMNVTSQHTAQESHHTTAFCNKPLHN
jgi:hypothetical protein